MSFAALGTTAQIATESDELLAAAEDVVRLELVAIDAACSRFRPDAELVALNSRAGRWVEVSPLLAGAIEAALNAARQTDGSVDPTVGSVLRLLEYDRDFASVPPAGPPLRVTLTSVPGYLAVEFDAKRRRVRLPVGVELDLGATGKAWAADRAAARAALRTGGGVLVSLGGDIAVRGPAPAGGWPVRVTDDLSGSPDALSQDITIVGGGLATSSVCVRRWQRGDRQLHHIIDPSTALPAAGFWRTVSVAAASCTDANTAATAAIVRGAAAPAWLQSLRLPARLVGAGGDVSIVGGWPRPRP